MPLNLKIRGCPALIPEPEGWKPSRWAAFLPEEGPADRSQDGEARTPRPSQAAGDGDEPPPGTTRHGLSQGCSCRAAPAHKSTGLLTPCPALTRRGLPEPQPPVREHPGSVEAAGQITETEICSFTSLPVGTGLESVGKQSATAWLQGSQSHSLPVQPLNGCSGSWAAGLGSHTSGSELLTLLIRLSSGDANQLRQTWALPARLAT